MILRILPTRDKRVPFVCEKRDDGRLIPVRKATAAEAREWKRQSSLIVRGADGAPVEMRTDGR